MQDVQNLNRNIMIKNGLISGFVASAISSLVLVLTTMLAVVPTFDFITIQGSIFGLAKTALSAWIIYFIIGTFIWGLLYAFTESRLPGDTAIKKGTVFGMIIWLIIMMIFMPLAGAGFFIMQYGFEAVLIVLVTDLVFGAAIGYFYNRLRVRI